MDFLQAIDTSSILVTLFFFALGSWFDVKTREVPDRVWLAYGPIGAALTVTRLLLDGSTLIPTAASLGLSLVIAFTLFYLGVFGGADSKGLICLGVALPLFPISYRPLIGYVHPFLPIVVVTIGFVCSVSVAAWIGLRNFLTKIRRGARMFDGLAKEPLWKKALASITGYPTTVSALKSTFYLYPIEEVIEEGGNARRRFRLFFGAETDRDEMVSKFITALAKVGSPNEVWVSPGLPMLLFIFIGLVITLLVGDPIFTAIFAATAR